ncbi:MULTISPECIES: hypothetical protein [Vibrionaceae]|uniref:hypothetical protein n=1 Tax=Vibrionaceae TaxID=641 RepID=UPI0011231B88|nr:MULTISPECIES: hypothetical protein [Vibrionaceae]EGQ8117163.1 hypothetical protein [Vibrio parahaemolyticus]EHK1074853.1 hypothetical protein [Vibrio parahaemolyticus]EHR0247357.1 hypothetical protein [Vibrio parahaemolyticus]EJE8557761.1 hypothetical protein [Vibrio vulnificus]ELK8510146.1 hypothetical protein [Vibrio vulnificus]
MGKFHKTKTKNDASKTYRFVKINGIMTKVDVESVDAALEEALKIRHNRKKDIDKELFVNGVTSQH